MNCCAWVWRRLLPIRVTWPVTTHSFRSRNRPAWLKWVFGRPPPHCSPAQPFARLEHRRPLIPSHRPARFPLRLALRQAPPPLAQAAPQPRRVVRLNHQVRRRCSRVSPHIPQLQQASRSSIASAFPISVIKRPETLSQGFVRMTDHHKCIRVSLTNQSFDLSYF